MPDIARTLLIALAALAALAGPASAADFNPGPGTYTADTTALTLTGPGPTNITGADEGGVAVFSFGTVNIPGGVTINAVGSRPFKILASGNLTLSGVINSNGVSATADFTVGPFAGGAGGGAGGTTTGNPGVGPGGGGATPASASLDGAAGGGFGGQGARGGKNGVDGATNGAPAGVVYGNFNGGPLQGGSGGGAGASVGGGGGGGGIGLFGDFVTITSGAVIFADGGGGAVGGGGASGGGSGGGILVHGETVDVSGSLVTRGGDGGAGGCCGDGGGGGGGRIAYQYRTLVASGSTFITGGTSGVRTTGSFTSGGASPDATGAVGVVTKIQAATSTTGPATGVSATGAALNGTTNPHGSGTTFHFEFGTTTTYGSRAPASDAVVGSDSSDHAVSQAVGGLAPNTTYHYRLVATDALGFTTNGADVGFTTPAEPPPPPPPPPPTLIPSTVGNNWAAARTFTTVITLSARRLPAGATVVVKCKTKSKRLQKRRCPYTSKTFRAPAGKDRVNVARLFRKKKLPLATKITITITAPTFIGKVFTYTTRSRAAPRLKLQCLAPGATKPGKCS